MSSSFVMSPAISSSENEIFISMKFTHSYHTLSKLFIESRMSFGCVLFEGGPGSEKWPLKQACREISPETESTESESTNFWDKFMTC